MIQLRLFVLPLFLAACSPSVASISVEPATLTMHAKEENKVIKATPKKETGELAVDALLNVKWSSSDPGVASVVNGTVVAHKSGEAQITAAVGETKAAAKVIVSIPAKLVLEPNHLELVGLGKSGMLKPLVKDENGKDVTDPQIIWSTSSSSVAMVSADGKVDANGIGQAVITAKVQALESKAAVQIKEPEIAKIQLTPEQHELEKVGDAVRLTATLYDAAGEAIRGIPVTWQTSNDKILTVSQEGLVTAVKKGKAKIIASARGKDQDLEITVKSPK